MLIKNEQGSALIFTIVVMFVLLILGGALSLYSMVEIGQAQRDEQDLQAFYLARSGADTIAEILLQTPEKLAGLLKKGETIKVEEQDLKNGRFSAEINVEDDHLVIKSTGFVGAVKHTVDLILHEIEIPMPDIEMALFLGMGEGSTEPAIDIHGVLEIHGPLGTNRIDPNAMKAFGHIQIDGEFFVGPGGDHNIVAPGHYLRTGSLEILDQPVAYSEPQFPKEFPQLSGGEITGSDTIVNDGAFTFLTVPPRGLTVETGSEGMIRKIVVDNLQIEGPIRIEGNGQLHLYVRNEIKFKNDSRIDIGKNGVGRNGLSIFYGGQTPFTNSGKNVNFNGNIIVRDSEVNLDQNSRFEGSIISASNKAIKFVPSGVSKGLLYAPKGSILVDSSMEIHGALVASSLITPTPPGGVIKIMFNEDYLPTSDNIPRGIFGGGSQGDTGVGKPTFSHGTWSRGK